PNPAELLGSMYMNQLLTEWGQEYDQILFDSPPLLAVADPTVLASKCDQMLLVVRAHHTPKEPAERALVALTTVHASVMGVLFNSMDIKQSYRYYYYYRYNHGYYGVAAKSHSRFGFRR